MSRSGYTDDCVNVALWRGAVDKALKGKRGQAFLRELRDTLLAMPLKSLIEGSLADAQAPGVCAMGSVMVAREERSGMGHDEAMQCIESRYPDPEEHERIASSMGIAQAMVREISYVNDDDDGPGETGEQRYRRVLRWAESQIKGD